MLDLDYGCVMTVLQISLDVHLSVQRVLNPLPIIIRADLK